MEIDLMEKSAFFICPVCRNTLYQSGRQLTCMANHSFDISRDGYVNLLLPNMKGSGSPGDSSDMISSRSRFLSAGYYDRLPGLLSEKIKRHMENSNDGNRTLLDAGCGEGYFLSRIEQALHESGIKFYAIDISRDAVRSAAKRKSSISCAVAGIYHMPVADASVSCLLNIFAPSPADEFMRVLSPSGIIIHVHPGENHLRSLRERLFSIVRPLRKEDKLGGAFLLRSISELEYSINIKSKDDLADLINMTPYAWKTAREKIDLFLSETEILETTAHFVISVYGK